MKRKKLKISIAVVLIVLLVLSIPLYIAYNKLSKINTVDFNHTSKELGIDEKEFKNPKKSEDDFVNILILGVDKADPTDVGRSDCTMIATIDKKHNKIKLTSLMRDMIVDTTGHTVMEGLNQDRLNHMYAYGGPLLSVKTVNENFNMNIKNYIKTDFDGLANIVDYVGGVQIKVAEDEVPLINSYQYNISKLYNRKYTKLTHAGLQTLDGTQAVAYSRIRYVGNKDFERTERQRTVLTEVFKKLSTLSITKLPSAADAILPSIETSLSKGDILSLGSYIITHNIKTVEQLRLPADGLNYSVTIRNTYFLGWKKDENLNLLHKFIYEN